MKSKHSSEFVRVLKEYKQYVKEHFNVVLRSVRTDNDPCFTDNHYGPARNTLALQDYLDSLPMMESIRFTHSPPGYQALNPVECAVRQLYHLMNFYLQKGHLSVMCWSVMECAAVYTMNRLPHPQSKIRARLVMSAYEFITSRKPDLTDMIAGPGELVVADFVGKKANSGENTGAYGYFVMPNEGGWLVRSFETNKLVTTHDIRRLSSPEAEMRDIVSLRHAIKTGMFRDG